MNFIILGVNSVGSEPANNEVAKHNDAKQDFFLLLFLPLPFTNTETELNEHEDSIACVLGPKGVSSRHSLGIGWL